MNKQYFQRMFSASSGSVYRFNGVVPEGQDPSSYITQQFVDGVGIANISTVVVNLSTHSVLYTNRDGIDAPSDFSLIDSLIPDPVVVVEPTVDPQPEGEV